MKSGDFVSFMEWFVENNKSVSDRHSMKDVAREYVDQHMLKRRKALGIKED